MFATNRSGPATTIASGPLKPYCCPKSSLTTATGCGGELDDGAVVEVGDEEVRPGHDHVGRILEAPSEHVDTPRDRRCRKRPGRWPAKQTGDERSRQHCTLGGAAQASGQA